MEEILCVYKPVGVTPLQLIEQIRADEEYKDMKIGYAGRLDPLAHGVMLLTIGEGNKNREKYLGLDKSYTFSVLFGIKTDSYDYLGLPDSLTLKEAPLDLEAGISEFIKSNTGKFSQSYPPFSSKPINGVPLYKLAKKGAIPEEDIPVKEVEIHKFKLKRIEIVDSHIIQKTIIKNLKKVKGHFRQTKTLKLWKELFLANPDYGFKLAAFEIECSSGTYVRSLAHRMGGQLGCGAIAFEIYRTHVGEFDVEEALRVDQVS